jgi:glycosyltransferase involved in cell wall biosynthesis
LKTKVTYVISNINKAFAFEWIAEKLDKKKIELSFILLNEGNSEIEKYLVSNEYLVKRINYKNKFDIPKALLITLIFLFKHKPKVVHTHLFEANLIGLSAAWFCRIKKRIYTRHHSSYHHDYFPNMVKYDRFCNFLATDIIAITQIVKEILIEKEGTAINKIHLINHGFKLENFSNIEKNSLQKLKQKYNSDSHFPVVGVISRYTEWKGIQYIIPAFQKLLVSYPNAKLILANAKGDYKREIKELLVQLPKNNYIEIEFENDIFSLYQLFDIFVHVPIDKYTEAFGQIYIEALASRVPSIFTISGIANDFIQHQNNALVVDYKNTEQIYLALTELMLNHNLKDKIIHNGFNDVNKMFQLSKMIFDLEKLYLNPSYE